MGIYFLDTSALLKLYINEAGTDYMLRLRSDPEAHDFIIADFAPLEFKCALNFVSSDKLLLAAASFEGLITVNPVR